MAKKKRATALTTPNPERVAMLLRNGGGTHGSKSYSRKVKHKGRYSE